MSAQLIGLTLLTALSICLTGYGLAQGQPAPASSPAQPSGSPAERNGGSVRTSSPAHTPSPAPSLTVPPDAKSPAQQNPRVGLLAIVAIVVAGGAGFYVYRVIRKGL